MTTLELQQYYANLLVLIYVGKPKAYAMISSMVAPNIMNQLPIAVQNAFTIGTTVVGGVLYPAASGSQLDIIGKYVGVTRNGYDTNGNPITLDDSDFTSLIQVAAITNTAGSSLATIQQLLNAFFPNEIFCYDQSDTEVMQMSYLITSSVGSQNLIELFVTEGLLPKPMGVGLSAIIYVPTVSLFGFTSYINFPATWSASTTYIYGQEVISNGIVYQSIVNNNLNNPVTNETYWLPIIYPFNSYSTYPTYEPYTWLSYTDSISI